MLRIQKSVYSISLVCGPHKLKIMFKTFLRVSLTKGKSHDIKAFSFLNGGVHILYFDLGHQQFRL